MLLLIYTKTVIFLPYKKYIYIHKKFHIYIYILQWLKYLLIIIEIILIS